MPDTQPVIRQPAVAGQFYPAEPSRLRHDVAQLLETSGSRAANAPVKALIVPHAGYVYSGAVAAQAYARLAAQAATIHRVVLLGPVHRVAVRGLALPDADLFATPLGQVPIDREAVAALAGLRQVVRSSAAHVGEHSLEVQLPFLQSVLGPFSVVPLAVGDATAGEVAEVIEALWGGPETLIVISSDLSHFLAYDCASEQDRATVARILAGQALTSHQQACGATPINGLLLAARRHALVPSLLALCNSGDSAGGNGTGNARDRVVGYAAIAFAESPQIVADGDGRGAVLLGLARGAIASGLGHHMGLPASAPWLREPGACFVTLTVGGQLRGCIGSLEPRRSLLEDVRANAAAAAFRDPRFPPLTAEEFDATRIEVSLLSPLEPMPVTGQADALRQLVPGVDGVVLEWRRHRGTFLPQVWQELPDPRDFLAQLKRKAGLDPDFWADDIRLSRYHVTKWSEPGAGRGVA